MKPEMSVPLGLSVEAQPTLDSLRERARERLHLIASGQNELSYLTGEAFVGQAKLLVINDMYELHGELPQMTQPNMFGYGPAGARRKFGDFQRQDGQQAEVIDVTVAALEQSASLVNRVAAIMATSANHAEELLNIERSESVDTGPARRFHYFKQADFCVSVDDQSVDFRSQSVRTATSVSEHPARVVMRFAPLDRHSLFMSAVVHEVRGSDVLKRGLGRGGAQKFRFSIDQDWQTVVLAGARWLGIPIHGHVVEAVSTCSLKPVPNEVRAVDDWPMLLCHVIDALNKVRQEGSENRGPR